MSEVMSNEIVDKLGRIIKLREITGKIRVGFFRALGARDSSNAGILAEYWNVMAVESIDGRLQGSIKALIDIEIIHSDLEKGEAMPLIEEWLTKKSEQRQLTDNSGEKELKK